MYELFVDMDGDGVVAHAKGVKKTLISSVFQVKKKMLFVFDYGDDWTFLVECMNIADPIAEVKYPRVVEKVGEGPEQYPGCDEEDDDEPRIIRIVNNGWVIELIHLLYKFISF